MRNETLFTDFYELTMSNSYHDSNLKEKVAVFDVFFRGNPLDSGYCVMGGIDQIINYIQSLHFDEEDIDYLRSKGTFSEKFLNYLKDFKFTGSIYAIPDGTPVFAGEPLITVKAPIIEAQLIETCLLSYCNANICFTTASRRIIESAGNIPVAEFGGRRAMGVEAAISASKCSYIAGCASTSNTLAGKIYNIPVSGTMAHSFITAHDSELDAFLHYADTYPDNCVLLVDTYNVLKSGVPNAIKTAEYLKEKGYQLKGIRIDSGDLAYLSKETKKMLIAAGYPDVSICLSNGLKEETIDSLKKQGAIIDSIGLGDNIVLPDYARVGCVYKNVAIEDKDHYISKIKVSDSDAKAITPGYKKVYRLYDKETNYALADVITLYNEKLPTDEYTLIDPKNDNNTKKVQNYSIRELQVPIFIDGKLVYNDPNIEDKKLYCEKEMQTLYPEVKRKLNPHAYYVDLSKDLLTLKRKLIKDARDNIR